MKAFLFGLITLAAPLAAQERWSVDETGGGATARLCLDQGGFCLAVGCQSAGGTAAWQMTWPRDGLPVVIAPEILVGETLAGQLALGLAAEGPLWTGPALADQAALIAALQRANRALYRVTTPDDAIELELPLAGSSAALGAVLERCTLSSAPVPSDTPAPESEPEPEPEPAVAVAVATPAEPVAEFANGAAGQVSDNPAALALAEAESACTGLGGLNPPAAGLVALRDVDGDGRNDAILWYGAFTCADVASPPFCGTGGCSAEIWRGLPDGNYEQILSGLVQRLGFPAVGAVTLDLHGSACGRSGAEPCDLRLIWDGSALVPAP